MFLVSQKTPNGNLHLNWCPPFTSSSIQALVNRCIESRCLKRNTCGRMVTSTVKLQPNFSVLSKFQSTVLVNQYIQLYQVLVNSLSVSLDFRQLQVQCSLRFWSFFSRSAIPSAYNVLLGISFCISRVLFIVRLNKALNLALMNNFHLNCITHWNLIYKKVFINGINIFKVLTSINYLTFVF